MRRTDLGTPRTTITARALGVLCFALSIPAAAMAFGCGGGCNRHDDTPGEQIGHAVEEAGDDVQDALDD